jgi:hypothetical protein
LPLPGFIEDFRSKGTAELDLRDPFLQRRSDGAHQSGWIADAMVISQQRSAAYR